MNTSAKAAAEVLQRGGYPHVIDGVRILDKSSAMEAIAQELAFPGWFGHNLDALYDCLTDLSWLPAGEHVLILSGAEGLKNADPKAYLGICGVLFDAQRALKSGDVAHSRQLTVILADS